MPALESARTAARASASRRWNSDLLERYRATPDALGQLIEVIDPELQEAATDAEMSRPGGGVAHILEQLQLRGVKL